MSTERAIGTALKITVKNQGLGEDCFGTVGTTA